MVQKNLSQSELLKQAIKPLISGILIWLANVFSAQAQPVRIEIPVQGQTYSQLVEQARPLVWQQLAQQFGSNLDRYVVTVEVFGQRGEAKAPLFLVTMNRDIWQQQPSPAQLEHHAQFFLNAMSLLYPPARR